MSVNRKATLFLSGLFLIGAQLGCQSTEQARIRFSYVVEAEQGLPEGLDTLIIVPAKTGATTDAKWSDLCVTVLRSLVNESRNRFGTQINISDRRDAQITFDEADLAAAGMSTKAGSSGGKLLAAEGAILSNINVKVERHIGHERTLSGVDIAALTGREHHGRRRRDGRLRIETAEVETITRNMTVQAEFKLVDTSNNKVLAHYSPRPYQMTDRTHASLIFGSSQTEASLTPRDQIIGALVEQAAREFISQLMPCRVDVDLTLTSSVNENCAQGVKLLRAEFYDEAIDMFEAAVVANPNDHRALFGAGVACEASGRYEQAMSFYRRAYVARDYTLYYESVQRMKLYGHRVRG